MQQVGNIWIKQLNAISNIGDKLFKVNKVMVLMHKPGLAFFDDLRFRISTTIIESRDNRGFFHNLLN